MIVHCAAERRPDVVERHTEAAVNLNVHATSTLAKEAGTSSPGGAVPGTVPGTVPGAVPGAVGKSLIIFQG